MAYKQELSLRYLTSTRGKVCNTFLEPLLRALSSLPLASKINLAQWAEWLIH